MWKAFIPELVKKHRIITIDLLGHGETECLGYVHTMEDQADMVHHVLHELKIRKSGFNWTFDGGYVALAFAELYPDNVKGIHYKTPLQEPIATNEKQIVTALLLP